MTKEMAISLDKKIAEVSAIMSNPQRPGNVNNEDFNFSSMKILSEQVVAVKYKKLPGGKLALCMMFWVPGLSLWLSIFITDSHVLGMKKIDTEKEKVEAFNYEKNLKEE